MGRQEMVHVAMYAWANEARGLGLDELKRRIKHEKMSLDHLTAPDGPCTSTKCANPSHLELVSRATNNRRQWERRRQRFGPSAGRVYKGNSR
jgi:hypothetical protein